VKKFKGTTYQDFVAKRTKVVPHNPELDNFELFSGKRKNVEVEEKKEGFLPSIYRKVYGKQMPDDFYDKLSEMRNKLSETRDGEKPEPQGGSTTSGAGLLAVAGDDFSET
jgi:hypothetical protein